MPQEARTTGSTYNFRSKHITSFSTKNGITITIYGKKAFKQKKEESFAALTSLFPSKLIFCKSANVRVIG
jgi:hypothetical protein